MNGILINPNRTRGAVLESCLQTAMNPLFSLGKHVVGLGLKTEQKIGEALGKLTQKFPSLSTPISKRLVEIGKSSGTLCSRLMQATAQKTGSDFKSLTNEVRQKCSDDATLSGMAYGQDDKNPRSIPDGYIPLGRQDLPKGLFDKLDGHPDPKNYGVLQLPHPIGEVGLQAMIVKKGNDITIAFAGTDVGNKSRRLPTVGADVTQALGLPSHMYKQAAELVKIMQDANPPPAKINLTGHSLGGGLAQYALASNINEKNKDFMSANCFNSAQLGLKSLGDCKDNLKLADEKITNIRLQGDPISSPTAKLNGNTKLLGTVYRLETDAKGYRIGDITQRFHPLGRLENALKKLC